MTWIFRGHEPLSGGELSSTAGAPSGANLDPETPGKRQGWWAKQGSNL